jgi:hypothetical protein
MQVVGIHYRTQLPKALSNFLVNGQASRVYPKRIGPYFNADLNGAVPFHFNQLLVLRQYQNVPSSPLHAFLSKAWNLTKGSWRS